jgi:hypothetical protein
MEYIHVKTIKSKNAIVRVYSPVLDDVERHKRYEAIKKAAVALLKGK